MRQENWECPELSCIKELCRRIENESKKERMSHELPCIRFWCSYSTPVSWALWCLSWLINAVCHLLQASLWANSLSWPSQLTLSADPLSWTCELALCGWPSQLTLWADPLWLTLSAGSLSWPSQLAPWADPLLYLWADPLLRRSDGSEQQGGGLAQRGRPATDHLWRGQRQRSPAHGAQGRLLYCKGGWVGR